MDAPLSDFAVRAGTPEVSVIFERSRRAPFSAVADKIIVFRKKALFCKIVSWSSLVQAGNSSPDSIAALLDEAGAFSEELEFAAEDVPEFPQEDPGFADEELSASAIPEFHLPPSQT